MKTKNTDISEENNNENNNSAVISDVKNKKHLKLPRKRSIFISVFLIFILIVCATSYFYINNVRNKRARDLSKELNNQTSILVGKGNYDEAVKNIENQGLNDKKSSMILASVYINKKDFEKALEILLTTEKKFGLDASIAQMIASSAKELKKYQLAKEYYLKAADLSEQDKSNPLGAAEAELYRKTAEGLTAK